MTANADIAGTTALITDVEYRKALPILRELGKAGVRVVGLSRHGAPLGAFSRYCSQVYRCPDYETAPDAFVAWLERLLRKERFDVFYPIEEKSLSLCVRHESAWRPYVKALVPSTAAMERAYDKWETIQCARSLDIPVPRSCCPEDDAALEALAVGWKGPAVVKPRKSSGSRGLCYVESPAELVAGYRKVAARFPRPIVQERIPSEGKGLGVFALLDLERTPLAVFGHRRLREYPVQGGPSTLRESYRDRRLIDQSVRLLQAMGLTGVAMVEYKQDARTGTPVLMEVNPRFWGSLQLAVLAGVNFPLLYHRASLGLSVQPVLDFPEGVRCRWLWPGDILHFLSNPDRFRLDPSFFRFRDPNTGYDILSLNDPLPAVGVLLEAIRKLWKRER